MRRSPALLLFAALLVVAAAACSKCGGKKTQGAAQVTRWLPTDVEAAGVVPDLGVLGERLAQLENMKLASFAAQLQGFPDAHAFANALMREVGVDLRSRDAMKKAGIAPERGLGVAVLPGNLSYAAVAVADADAFGAFIKRLAQQRLGAGVETKTASGGREVVTFSRAPGGSPELGYVRVDGDYALVAAKDSAAKLGTFAALAEEQSLAHSEALGASLARLPAERDLYLFVPQNLTAKKRPGLLSFTATVKLAKDALHVRIDTPWLDTPESLKALDPKEGPDLTGQLPPDAFVVARFGGDPTALAPIWPVLTGPYLQRAFADAGFSVRDEVLANLSPGPVASLSVSPTIPMGQGMPELDVRRTNPFRYVHLVAFAQPKDAPKAPVVFAKLPAIAPKFGATIEPLEKDGQTFFVTRYARGEGVHFAQAKDGRVVLASPLGRLEQTISSLAATPKPAGPPLLRDAALKDVLLKSPVAAVVDLDQLRESVKALPPEAWGIGGFAIKASAVRWLEATDDLRAITLALSRKGNAVQADLALRFTKR
ncbi:MAG: hypothetical protein IRZ16_07445 [Myxococcaceae bacterium]|nr:hypothetical protein [Myxococcaceae bacterium]